MAQKLHTTYGGGKVGAPTAEYPGGIPRNVSSPLAGDGTPNDEIMAKDLWGFLQAIMDQSGLTYTEVPDTALASQYLEGLQVLFGALALDNKRAGQIVWNSITRVTVNPGVWKTAGMGELIHIVAPIAKDVKDDWVDGSGVGGKAEDASAFVADTWYRRFVARKPGIDITEATVFFDDNATGANFFTGTNAIAAGYTDPSLYTRAGWVRLDSGDDVEYFLNDAENTDRYLWQAGPQRDVAQSVGPNDGTREAFTLDHCPPNCIGDITWMADRASNGVSYVTLTEENQGDNVPGNTKWDMRCVKTSNDVQTETLRHFWRVNAAQEMYARIDGADTDIDQWQAFVNGWIDEAVTP